MKDDESDQRGIDRPALNSIHESSSIQLAPEQVYYLQRTQVLAEVQEELIKWGKRRFWIVALASLAVGFIGMRTIVRDLASDELRAAIRASADADAAATAARDATTKARAGVEDYRKTVEELRGHAVDVDKTYKDFEIKLGARSENVREEARLSRDDLDGQIASIRTVVAGLLTRVTSAEAARTFQAESANLQQTSKSRRATFSENSQFTIPLSYRKQRTPLTSDMSARLQKAGFKVEDHPNTSFTADEKEYFKDSPPGALTRLSEVLMLYNPSSRAKAEEIAAVLKDALGTKSIRLTQDSNTTTTFFPVWIP
jgi:hypothetical protein